MLRSKCANPRSRRVPTTSAVITTIEMLEKRLQMDATYKLLDHTQPGGGPLTQDWSNTGLITATDNWGSVPSIQGFRGERTPDLATGTDPQTVINDPAGDNVAVLANQTNPNTLATGGVAEFDTLANPVVAFQGSAAADAPHLQFYVDTTGISTLRVQYTLRDVDGSTDNAIQPVALQYRVGETGNFTNVPAAFVADASTGPSLATKTTNVDVTLPADALNQSKVQIRVLTTNALGSDEWIGVDDIVISDGSIVAPSVQFSAASAEVTEGSGTTQATITVTRTGDLSAPSSVNYATIAGGTATAGSDYTSVSGTVSFVANQASATFNVPILGDNVAEMLETVNLQLSSPTGATLGLPSTATLSIRDDDTTLPSGLLLNELNVDPPGADGGFEWLELKGTPGQSLSNVFVVSVEGDAGTGLGGADVVFDLSTQTLGANGLLLIKSPNNGTLNIDPDTTVVNDPQLNTGILENGSNSFIIVYRVGSIAVGTDLDPHDNGTLELPSGSTLVDGVGWLDGDNAGDKAYAAVIPTLVAPPAFPGAATRDPANTTALTPDAWFAGVLNNAVSYDISRSTLNTPNGEMLTGGAPNSAGNPNNGTFAFGPTTYTVSENVGTLTIPVYRFGGSIGDVSVDYTGNDNTANNGSDFTGASGTLSFAAGQTSANIVITIVNDNVAELPENFTVSLGNATNGSGLNATRTTATVNIDDDDVAAPSGVLLNEVVSDPPGTDQPNEYAEIKATAGAVLNKVYFISVEGDNGSGIGSADQVFNLTGVTVGSNGLIMIRGTNAFGTEDGNTTIVTSTIFDAPNGAGLENGSNSFLVVFSPTSIPSGTDLDTNDDGTLDLPSGAVVLDGVGWLDGGAGDVSYGATLSLTTPATNPPGAASRFRDNTDANSASAWFFGKLSNTNGPGFDYNPAQSSANLPSGAKLTPGAENYVVTDTTPPTVTGSFDFDAARQQFTLQFSEPVQDITAADITLTQLPVTTIPPENIIITHPQPDRIVLQFQNYPFNALPDGNYNLLLHKDNVKDLAGNALASDFSMGFFSYDADANRDMKVNALDLNALATNFGSSGPFSKGDFNYDGTVNTLDFNELASHFNQTLPLLPAAPLGLGSLFSSAAIANKDELSGVLN